MQAVESRVGKQSYDDVDAGRDWDDRLDIYPTLGRRENEAAEHLIKRGSQNGTPSHIGDSVEGNLFLRKNCDIRTYEIALVTCFNFPYGLICSTFGLYLLPEEAQWFFSSNSVIQLGLSLFLVGITQLVCPIAGKMSDLVKTKSCLWKRLPFIVGGCVCGGLSCLAMWYSSLHKLALFYYLALFWGMVGLNIVYSVQSSLVSDLIPEYLYGSSSGFVAFHTACGSLGFAVLLVESTMYTSARQDLYLIFVVLIVISCVIQMVVARSIQRRTCRHDALDVLPLPLTTDTLEKAPLFKIRTELIEREQLDSETNWDFILVFASRTCYYVAVSCQVFMLYYIRDVLGTSGDDDQRYELAAIAFVAQGTAACVAVPFGRLTDYGRVGKKGLIYFSCALMAFAYICFILAPYAHPYEFIFVLCSSFVYGIGNGCFLSVDYALALATLPNKNTIGQMLGLWGISSFVGTAIGPFLWSLVIFLVGRHSRDTFSYSGFTAMLSGGVFVTFLAALLVACLKNVK